MIDPQKSITGVSIRPDRVFVSVITGTGGAPRVESTVEHDIPDGVVKNGIISDTDAFSRILKKIFREQDIKGKQVVAGMTEAGVINRIVKVPEIADARLKELLKSEIKKYVFSGDPFIIDHFRVDGENVFVSAIKRKTAVSLLSVFEKAGLNLVGIESPLVAVIKALTGSGGIDPGCGRAGILILAEDSGTTVSVVSKGIPVYSRDLGMSEVTDLVKEVEVTEIYWEERSPETPLDRIIISGDSRTAVLMRERLAGGPYPVVEGKPVGEAITDFNLSRSVSLGAALKNVTSVFHVDVNLLPPEKFLKMKIEKWFLSVFFVISVVLFIFFFVSVIFSAISNSYEKKLRPLEVRLGATLDILDKVEKINNEKRSVLERLRSREKYIKDHKTVRWDMILSDIKDLIPLEAWLTDIHSEGGSILKLHGRALSQEAVYKYVKLLGYSSWLSEPELLEIYSEEGEEGDIYAFSISCPVAGKNGG